MFGWSDRANKDRGGQNVYVIACYIRISEYILVFWDLNDYKSVVGFSIVTIHSKKQSISQPVDHSANKSTN